MKRYFLLLVVVAISCLLWAAPQQFTVVIDPGHGGKDPGAVGTFGREKEINLNVSLAVGQLITQKHPEVKVVYTRTTDKYVTLQERAAFANKENGDIFICIHTNASRSANAKGTETYVLGLEKSDENFEIAKRENSVILLEEGYHETYQGFDPTSPESYIMFEFMQAAYFEKSILAADCFQKELTKDNRTDRGVRQAIFWVLHQTKMPSVLIELGFISNKEEEKFLTSTEGQQKMAEAISAAFDRYKHEYDKRTVAATPKTPIEPEKKTNEKISEKNRKTEKNVTTKKPQKSEVVYKVQIFSTNRILKANDSEFKGLKNCDYYTENSIIKYTYGNETDYNKIIELKNQIKEKFKDAFIVAFHNDKKISLAEAKKLTKK